MDKKEFKEFAEFVEGISDLQLKIYDLFSEDDDLTGGMVLATLSRCFSEVLAAADGQSVDKKLEYLESLMDFTKKLIMRPDEND